MAIFGYCWVASWMTHLSLLFTLPAQNHIRDTDHVFQRLSQFWQQRSIDESETRKEIGDFSLFYDGYILVSKYSRVYLDNTVAKVFILTHFSRPGKVTKMRPMRLWNAGLYRRVEKLSHIQKFLRIQDFTLMPHATKMWLSASQNFSSLLKLKVCVKKRAWQQLCRGVEKYT